MEPACLGEKSEGVEVKVENIVDEIHEVKAEASEDICPAVDLQTEPTEITNEEVSAAADLVPLKIDIKIFPPRGPSDRG